MSDWIKRWFPWLGPVRADTSQRVLTDGSPVTEDHKELKPNGQQKGYVILSEEARAKGYVRPVRRSYKHIGIPGPEHPLRDLTPAEIERWGKYEYVKYEAYPKAPGPSGRFWTQVELDSIGKGCGTVTSMGQAIAETYAREPGFYGGTFCCGCGKHLPVGKTGEFVWVDNPDERVGT